MRAVERVWWVVVWLSVAWVAGACAPVPPPPASPAAEVRYGGFPVRDSFSGHLTRHGL